MKQTRERQGRRKKRKKKRRREKRLGIKENNNKATFMLSVSLLPSSAAANKNKKYPYCKDFAALN